VLVMDQLDTNSIASFYKVFAPHQDCDLAAKLDTHYTPRHGSWLNVAKIELSALGPQCLD